MLSVPGCAHYAREPRAACSLLSASVNIEDIERRLTAMDLACRPAFIYDLLRAYGLPRASITRLERGSLDRSDQKDEILWKGRVYFRMVATGAGDLHDLIDEAGASDKVRREMPRFLMVRDSQRLLAADTKTGDTLDIPVEDLPSHVAFFLPWAGIEKARLHSASQADIKAAEKMAKLYDEIIKHNEMHTETAMHDLNVFFSRLLFCFFAEDTEVFDRGLFTNAVASLTQPSGSDLNHFLDRLFAVLNTEPGERGDLPEHLASFGYVNGKLFARPAMVPRCSARARAVMLECGTLDWSAINPDIFGSMIQAVVHPSQREGLGMHYTSVENILKVVRPLFLDELTEAFDRSQDSIKALERLLERISAIRIFDPACGSGNFLVISYKELRRLEHQILLRIAELDPKKRGVGLFKLSSIHLENFYGIEIDDFASEIATLSLWLTKHQMNVEFKELFGAEIPLIPLKEGGNIVHGNAARLDWTTLVPPGGETYVLGNPPYQGGTKQSRTQKEDLAIAFDDSGVHKYLDYVSIWLFKAARYANATGASVGFVTTNSISQGNHVSLLWPRLWDVGVEISFAHSEFRWANSAKANAGVICVVIGLTGVGGARPKRFYSDVGVQDVGHINAYLVPEGSEVIIRQSKVPLFGLPQMVFGSMPRDGGHLILSEDEQEELIAETPGAARFIREYVGAEDFIQGQRRYCLWIPDSEAVEAASIPGIASRLAAVRSFRLASAAASTRKFADEPHRFVQKAHKETSAVIVPRVSSERRDYVPMGFLSPGVVISDAANAIYGAEPWVFGLIQSRMHMAWVRAVAGRLKSDLRYSAGLVYHTFPIPPVTGDNRGALAAAVYQVLSAREWHSDATLAELYSPGAMPQDLRAAHNQLEQTVDAIYREDPFDSDEERLKLLFAMYSEKAGALA